MSQVIEFVRGIDPETQKPAWSGGGLGPGDPIVMRPEHFTAGTVVKITGDVDDESVWLGMPESILRKILPPIPVSEAVAVGIDVPADGSPMTIRTP